jgi:NAD(P)-dependent dehydrogenase (short-subunit alcohol dehydrogenase family)
MPSSVTAFARNVPKNFIRNWIFLKKKRRGEMGRLDEKVSVITGGAGVIGTAAGKLFAEEGSRVLLVDLDEDTLKSAVETIGSGNVSYAVADVSDPEQVQGYVRTAVDRYGGIDVFLNNAGIEGAVMPIVDYPVDMFDRVMAVNIRGVWLGLKYVIPVMAEKGAGSIVISSSVAGVTGSAGVSAYTCSKHAVIGIMRTVALECAPLNIRVNTINPSPVESRMMRSLEGGFGAMMEAAEPDEEHLPPKELVLAGMPMGRYATAEEVANMMLFLGSDESSFCSGSVFMVDGGSTCD